MAISVAAASTQITAPQGASSQRPTAATGNITASAVEAAFQAGGSRSKRPLPPSEKPVSIAQYCSANHRQMIAINSALQVDLSGQVCADSIGTQPYSGFGGQADFVRGAARSKGGKSITALPSTAKNGAVSRIVPVLDPGAGVVTTRADVHYVVTEYGIAYLRGKTLRQRAQALKVAVQPVGVRTLDELDAALQAARRQVDALTVVEEGLFVANAARVAELATRHRIPSIGFGEYCEAGGLMAYGPSYVELFQRAAGYVDKILRGAKPGNLPVEQPTTFDLVLNLKTARALGLTIPPAVRARAAELIQ